MNARPEQWLVDAARSRVSDFAAQLRTVGDGQTSVPNLEWTVADLAQHVACLPGLWSGLHDGGDAFTQPPSWAIFSNEARAHITETDPAALADLIDTEFARYIDLLADGDQPRWNYAVSMPRSEMLGLVINEMIMHGLDLAAVTGSTVSKYSDQEAQVGVDAMVRLTPVFIDPAKAGRQPDGVYHVKIRGGKDFTWTKQGGELIITEGKPAKAAAHLNTDAAIFLLSSLQRVGQVRAALSGKMITYGLKPWRFLGLGTMARDGV